VNRNERKKHLIAEGAIYRAEVMLSKQALQDSLQPESLARGALHQLALGALSMLARRGGLPGVKLQTLLPLAVTAIGALAKRKWLLKIVLRGAALAGVTAGVAVLVSRKKRAQEDGSMPDDYNG
jgi:hypothetical protein